MWPAMVAHFQYLWMDTAFCSSWISSGVVDRLDLGSCNHWSNTSLRYVAFHLLLMALVTISFPILKIWTRQETLNNVPTESNIKHSWNSHGSSFWFSCRMVWTICTEHMYYGYITSPCPATKSLEWGNKKYQCQIFHMVCTRNMRIRNGDGTLEQHSN